MEKVIQLTVMTGPHKNERFNLRCPARCVIGRRADCFIQLNGTERDQLVSRRHCELVFEPLVLRLRDLASSNGTYFNGARIDELELALVSSDSDQANSLALKHGDLLTVGGTTLKFDFVDFPADDEVSVQSAFWDDDQAARKAFPIACV